MKSYALKIVFFLLFTAPILSPAQTKSFISINKFMETSRFATDSNLVFFIKKQKIERFYPIVAGQKIKVTLNSGMKMKGIFDSIANEKIYMTSNRRNISIALNPSNIRKIKVWNNLNEFSIAPATVFIVPGALIDLLVVFETIDNFVWLSEFGTNLNDIAPDLAIGTLLGVGGTGLIIQGLKFKRKSFNLTSGKNVIITF